MSDFSAAQFAAPGRPVVTLENVGKTFATGVVALDRLNLDIWPGEFVTLLGPSGCGKSTALRLIAGLSEPTRGSIDWADKTGANRGAGALGFVFQEPTLMPWTTVARNVRLPLKLMGINDNAVPRVEAALARVGLADFASSYPRELSGGMQMRVSIARALVTEPKLLLMDEPFAALDEITRFKLNDDLVTLWRSLGKTVVFVTHSVFEFGCRHRCIPDLRCTGVIEAAASFATDQSGASRDCHRLDARFHRRGDANRRPCCEHRDQLVFSWAARSRASAWYGRLDSAFGDNTDSTSGLERAAGNFQRRNFLSCACCSSFDDAGRDITRCILADSVRSWFRFGGFRQHSADCSCVKTGGYDWGYLAYAVGFGGSIVWFGSSAGVALSNQYPEAKSVGVWLRHSWYVAVAYVIGFFVMLAVVGWHPDVDY